MAQGHRANKRQVPTQAGGARIGFSHTTSVGGFFFFFKSHAEVPMTAPGRGKRETPCCLPTSSWTFCYFILRFFHALKKREASTDELSSKTPSGLPLVFLTSKGLGGWTVTFLGASRYPVWKFQAANLILGLAPTHS